MFGLMQDWPLLCHKIIDYAALQHGKREIVTRSAEGPIVRSTYDQVRTRALKVAQKLNDDGYRKGDRIATLAWNTAQHLECWYGIMGIGAICHTLNPRLPAEQIAWIMRDAEDTAIFVDSSLLHILEDSASSLPTLRQVIVLGDKSHVANTKLAGATSYEEWLAEADGDFIWHAFDEKTAAGLCYTSGTTGNPKGILYSHRSNTLHALRSALPDAMDLSSRDVVMPVVPMYHANAWGLLQSAPMVGSKLVLPGQKMDGASIYELLDKERVTFSAAVPTVWLMLLQYLEDHALDLPWLERVVIGGAACPRRVTEIFKSNYDVEVIHAWGMTEMSPVGTLATLKPEYADYTGEPLMAVRQMQGHAPFGVELKVTDDNDDELPWDGKTFGNLKVRGFAVASSYYRGVGMDSFSPDGWFTTGDVAHIDPMGYIQITDRAKDVIKSGGEWISTIDLENLAISHADVAEAAAIGLPHAKWDERPLLIVVPKPGMSPRRDEILDYMKGKIAKWWLPDDVIFVDQIPHTSTGKVHKAELRKKYAEHQWPAGQTAVRK